MSSDQPIGDSNPLPSTDSEQLLRYRVQEAVQERLLVWARRQFAPVALALNVAGFLGLWSYINSTLNSSIDKQTKATVDTTISDQVVRFRASVNDEFKRLDEQRADLERIRSALRDAKSEADKSADSARSAAEKLSNDFLITRTALAKQADGLQTKILSLTRAADELSGKVEKLQTNLHNFGEDVWQRADLAAEILAEQIARVKALEDTVVYHENSLRALASSSPVGFESRSLADSIAERSRHLLDNSKTLIVFMYQTNKGIAKSVSDWEIRLKLSGFQTRAYSTDTEEYNTSQDLIRESFADLDEITATHDSCIVYSRDSKDLVPIIRASFDHTALKIDCLSQRDISVLSASISADLNSHVEKYSNLVVVYVTSP